MALPQELTVDDELAAFAESNSDLQNPSALLGAYREWALAMDNLAVNLEELERRLSRMKNKGTEVLNVLRSATPARTQAINFDELVRHYEELEEKMRGYALPIIERAKAKKKEQFSLPVSRAERSKAIAMYNKIIRIYVQALESIRDLRWQLMALRAASEAPSGSPVFSDSRALKTYLDKL
jgi:hypothetical protein